MNMSSPSSTFEPAWRTYLKAGLFVMPALCVWGFSAVFLFPKLQQIWRDAGFDSLTARRVLEASSLLGEHGLLISTALVLLLGLLEWRSRGWPRHRRLVVSIGVFLLNAAILALITAMLTTALLAAPGLLRAR